MSKSLIKKLSLCLTDLLFQLEAADERQVNSDFAIALMEVIGAELQGLESEDVAEFVAIIREVAGVETNEGRRRYLEAFPESFGLA